MNERVRVMGKFNKLMEKGSQREREQGSREVTIDTVWFSLLIAQSEIIILLEDIRKMMSASTLNRFGLIDISQKEDSSDGESSSDPN